MAIEPGRMLSHYRLIEKIGEGGMGVVWKARDTTLDRDVAVKLLPGAVAQDQERLARFEREAKAVAKLSHPNILEIHGFGREDDVTYAVMELLEGKTVEELLAGGAPGWHRAIDVGAAVADGLAAAHQSGIIHRDLKPSNIFLTDDGRVKILDFGLARTVEAAPETNAHSPTVSSYTEPGAVMGTVSYMSPEQVRAEPADHRSDIFSLGCVLYEMIAGSRAFSAGSGVETMAAILHEEPPDLSSMDAALPAELAHIVQRCLEKRPEKRFQSAGDLAFALRSVLSGSAPWQRLQARPRRSLRWWAAGAAAIVVVAVTILWWQGRRGDEAPRPGGLNPDRVVVAVFENRTGDASLDGLGPMVSDWITQGLAQTGVVEVVPSMTTLLTVAAGQPGPGLLSAYAEKTGAGIVVSGVYYLQEEALLFQATVTDVALDKVIHSFQPISGNRADPMPAIEELRQRVMGLMVTHEDPREVARLLSTPPQFEAYKEYIAGLETFGLDEDRTVVHFEKAAELDPSLYAARLFLVYMYGERQDQEKVAAVLQDLIEDAKKLGPYERLWLDVLIANSEHRYFEVLRLLQEAERISPGDLLIKDWLGVAALALNRPQVVVDTMEGVEIDRVQDRVVSMWWHQILCSAYHMLGRFQLQLETARVPVQWYPDLLRLRVNEVVAAAALGDLDEIDRVIEESLAVRPGDDFHAGDVMLMAARELRAHGYLDDSLALAGRAVDWCRGRGLQDELPETMRGFLARALYQAERWNEARELFRELAAEDPGNSGYRGYLGALAARAGDASEAMAVAEALPAGLQAIFWRARIAALLGDEERAVTLLREALAQGARFNLSFHSDMDFESLRDYRPFQELLRPKG